MKRFVFLLLIVTNIAILTAQETSTEFNNKIRAKSAGEAYNKSNLSENESENKAENEDEENLTITKINFSGLKKTRKSYVQSKFKNFIGKPATSEKMHDFETAVQLEGLFDDIQIQTEKINDEEAEINVSVKEKITFIPLPFAMYSSSGFMAGGVVMDTNAFGQKDMFMVGGFFSNDSKSGMATFSKAPKEHGIPGFSIFFIGSSKTPEFKNLDDDTILKYKSTEFSVSLSLSEKISEHITFSNGFGYKYSSSKENSDFAGLNPEGIIIGSTSLSLGYSKSDWNGIFMSTNSAAVSADFGLTNSDDADFRFPMAFSFSIGEQHPIFVDRLRMYQKISGFYGINNHISSFAKQGAGSVSILSGNFATERIVGGNAGFEFALKKFKWGMISVYADYQVVYTKNFTIQNDGDYEFEHGPNGGMRFYLAKIAFPALAMGLAYNVPQNRFQFSAAMGVSF